MTIPHNVGQLIPILNEVKYKTLQFQIRICNTHNVSYKLKLINDANILTANRSDLLKNVTSIKQKHRLKKNIPTTLTIRIRTILSTAQKHPYDTI